MLKVLCNTSDITSSVAWDTLNWNSVLTKEVDRLEFEIKYIAGKILPALGDDILLEESTDGGSTWQKLFGGVLVERNQKNLGGVLLGYECRAKDYSQDLDGLLVTKNYPQGRGTNVYAHEILIDLLATYTTGFTHAGVKTASPAISSIKFNYDQVSRAIGDLCDQIGWDWYVDPDKDIHFFNEETLVAPFNLDDSSGNFEWATLQMNETILNLKNHYFVRGGEYKKTISEANAIDKYIAGTGQKTFPLAYKYDNITVKKNGSVMTIGTDQQTDPATVDLLYNFNEKFITFSTGLTSGDSVVVYGDAYIPIIASVRDQVSIATYGEFQDVKVDKSINSVAEAQSLAKQELKKYSENVHEGTFKTIRSGLRVGQQILINSTIRGINRKFKITRINAKARGSDHLEYEVYLLASGEISFTDIMVGLLGKDKKNIVIASNEVLQRLEDFFEGIGIAETITTTKKSPPYTYGVGGSNDGQYNFSTYS